jgi:transcriptional/translational regulatory protein YebC/TACO1
MAEPGAVAWQFERKGLVQVPRSDGISEDDLMLLALEAGADDITDAGDHWQVTTPPSDLPAVRTALEAAGVAVDSAEVTLLPTTTVELDKESDARKVLHLVDLLEEHDDVQSVYANFDIPDEMLATMSV